jgi:adenylate cyclase class 2
MVLAVRLMLAALDFAEMVTVDKNREEWVLGDAMLVSIDHVVGLGSFVEFEYSGGAESVEDANQELSEQINRIGVQLGERDRRGYPYQLLGRARGPQCLPSKALMPIE